MGTRTVITRTRRSDQVEKQDFPFTREMVPALAPEWNGPALLRDYRALAWENFLRLPMPTLKDEAWRRTDLRSLRPASFHLLNGSYGLDYPKVPKSLMHPLVGDQHGGQIIIHPGKIDRNIDPALTEKGVIFTDFMTAEKQYPEQLAALIGQVIRSDEGRFAAMAASLSRNGVFIYVPRGVHVADPLHSVLWAPGEGLANLSHVLVWLEDESSLTYVHESASPKDAAGEALHAGIVEIHVGNGANLRFVELQSWGENVWNFTHERARVGRDGNLDWIFGALGSHVTKNFSDLDLVGEGATGRMSGFYFTDGDQHLDHDTQQNHKAPNTTSDLLFKGALKDRSRSVWQGMIYVAPGAQKTDGYQANRNLVLSPKARADSIPGLEILADDVRCTHGATVGKIDPEPIFYLRSRGIPYNDAERLIVEGFFDPIMQRIPFEGVRERFQQAIVDKLG
jgi:Fe-S cluster assembly protein SufD